MVKHGDGALHLLEQGPHAPQCPNGHGPLTTVTDPDAPTGAGLACPTCGARRELETSMLRTLLNPDLSATRFDVPLAGRGAPEPEAEPEPEPEPVAEAEPEPEPRRAPEPDTDRLPAPRLDPEPETERIPVDALWKAPAASTRDDLYQPLPSPRPTPRGLRPDGTIRTTGWLQIGGRTVSSGLWAALAGLALGLALIDFSGWLPPIFAAAGGLGWFVLTRWIRPASAAVNTVHAPVERLEPGTAVRLHGPIGPVGIVEDVVPLRRNRMRIDFDGGTHRTVSDTARCHVVELRS